MDDWSTDGIDTASADSGDSPDPDSCCCGTEGGTGGSAGSSTVGGVGGEAETYAGASVHEGTDTSVVGNGSYAGASTYAGTGPDGDDGTGHVWTDLDVTQTSVGASAPTWGAEPAPVASPPTTPAAPAAPAVPDGVPPGFELVRDPAGDYLRSRTPLPGTEPTMVQFGGDSPPPRTVTEGYLKLDYVPQQIHGDVEGGSAAPSPPPGRLPTFGSGPTPFETINSMGNAIGDAQKTTITGIANVRDPGGDIVGYNTSNGTGFSTESAASSYQKQCEAGVKNPYAGPTTDF